MTTSTGTLNAIVDACTTRIGNMIQEENFFADTWVDQDSRKRYVAALEGAYAMVQGTAVVVYMKAEVWGYVAAEILDWALDSLDIHDVTIESDPDKGRAIVRFA